MHDSTQVAPPWQVSRWFNTRTPLTLEGLRGRVVVLHTFQMLCPGCVSHGLPQASRIHDAFGSDQVQVVGLHTVFEHHDVMNARALEVFIHEYRLKFPIGVDQAAAQGVIPLTMQAYELQGTPSVVLFDKQGHIRLSHFGRLDDLTVGALIGQLLQEPLPAVEQSSASTLKKGCDEDVCRVN
jgi:hypothetical protein